MKKKYMHDCLRGLSVQLAFSGICWKKLARRKLRRINYQRLMEIFLSVHRQSFSLREPRQWDGCLVSSSSQEWLSRSLRSYKTPPLSTFTLVCVKPFYSDGDASMRVAAFRVIKTIHLHAAIRWFFLFFFFCDSSSRRILLGSAVTVARSSWLQWQCSAVATRPLTVVKRHIVYLMASWRMRENIIFHACVS